MYETRCQRFVAAGVREYEPLLKAAELLPFFVLYTPPWIVMPTVSTSRSAEKVYLFPGIIRALSCTEVAMPNQRRVSPNWEFRLMSSSTGNPKTVVFT